jgi:aspartate racemase
MSLSEKQFEEVQSQTVFGGAELIAFEEQQAPSANSALVMSAIQERIWFLEQMEPGNPANILFHGFHLSGNLDVEVLRLAIDEVVERQQALRTTFAAAAIYSVIDGRAVPIIAEPSRSKLPLLDLSELSTSEREAEVARRMRSAVREPFDLSKGPLFRLWLLRLSEREHILLLSMHRIIADEESCRIFVRELFSFYDRDARVKTQALPVQYTAIASREHTWLQTAAAKQKIDDWKRLLQDAPALLELPADRPRPPKRSYGGARASIEIPVDVVDSLEELGKRAASRLSTVLLAAFQILLARYTSRSDVVLGLQVTGRTAESQSLIGPLTNNIPIRTEIVKDNSFLEQLKRAGNSLAIALSLRDIPFERLLEELHPQRSLSHTPVFQVSLSFETASAPLCLDAGELNVRELDLDNEVCEFDLILTGPLACSRPRAGLTLSANYNTDLFAPGTIARLLKSFVTLLAGVAAAPEQRLSAAPIVDAAEVAQLTTWNNTRRSYPRELCVHELIETQAALQPQQVAVVFGTQALSYDELNRRANQLAAYLRGHLIEASLVGIYLERGPELVVALLAVLKMGAAYVPLDTEAPSSRLAFMIEDSGLQLILTHENLAERLSPMAAQVVCLETKAEEILTQPPVNLTLKTNSSSLAYVIYTSGSTGLPKAVEIPHSAVVNFLTSMQQQPGLTEADRLLAVTTLSFDIAGLEIYLPLMAGARVELCSRAEAADGKYLIEKLANSGITVMQATPATWRLLLEAGWEGSQGLTVLCGGEALSRDLADELLRRCKTVWNMYGPTETTIWSAVGELELSDGPVLLGEPIANTQLYVLDEDLNLAPLGVAGELYIGGEGLARGYHGRAELTAQRFVPNPFSSEPGARIYRTGDLVRRLSDGRMEFLGRLDHQVKIRGFRIELGEVMQALSQHPSIKENIVTAAADTSGGQRLVAYLVAEPGVSIDVGAIRTFLKSKLPDYMIPAVFVVLENMPLTANGKVDVKALPAANDSRPALPVDYAKPQDALETQLVTIWQKVLGLGAIGVNDNFFDLGGHSLLAVRLFAQIENRFGRVLPLATLFQAPTIRELATVLRKEGCRQWSSLVAIRSGGSKPPLFCIHAAGANVLIYRPLANHLDVEQPVYALQALGLDGVTPPLTQVEEMAHHYLKEIRALQPDGPYYLLGGSFGGLVAFEMAQQLRSLGQQVGMLALLDTYCPLHSLTQRMRCHWAHFVERGPATYVADAFTAATKKFRRKFSRAASQPEMKAAAGTVLPSMEFQDPLVRTVQANIEAENTYVPRDKVYCGRITYFYAEDLGGAPAHEDNRLHWAKMTTAGIDIHRIPGTHITMREEPNVALLAKKLTECLEKAQRTS